MERSVKYLLEGLNQFHGANLALNSDVDQDKFGKVTKQNKHDRQEVSSFPAGHHKATRNRHDSTTHTNRTHSEKSIHKQLIRRCKEIFLEYSDSRVDDCFDKYDAVRGKDLIHMCPLSQQFFCYLLGVIMLNSLVTQI